MSARQAIGRVAFWVVAGVMVPLIALLIFDQESDEVRADATTTGTVTKHATDPQGPTYKCWFSYTVDGERYRSADECDHDATPVGSRVTVNYRADEPSAGFLHGDVGWGDKLGRTAEAGGVLAGIGLATWFAIRRFEGAGAD